MIRRSSIALLLAAIALGCNGEPEPEKAAPDKPGEPVQDTGLKELKKEDVKVGTGPAAEEGDLVLMEYTGTFKDGRQFDSNKKKNGSPYAFVLGAGEVVPGWDVGIPGMKKGGVRKLSVPWGLGYGAGGNGADIPGKTDLYFEVKLLDLVKKGEEQVLTPVEIKTGSGKPVVNGSTVTIHVVGRFVNGRVFEDTRKTKKPYTFKVGARQAYPHMEVGVTGMRAGGVRSLRVPPDAAFGLAAKGPDFPGNMVLLYEIEMIRVK